MSQLVDKLINNSDAICGIGVNESDVDSAEEMLGTKFSEEYREYLIGIGITAVDGHELTGICKPVRVNVVSVTLHQRELNPEINPEWYVVEEANIDGIVIWQSSDGSIYETILGANAEKISESLEQYLNL